MRFVSGPRRNSGGYTLVEVLVGVAVSGLMATLVLGVVIRVTRLVTYGTKQTMAGHVSRSLQTEMTRRVNLGSVSSTVSADGRSLFIYTYGSNKLDCVISSYSLNEETHRLSYDPDVSQAGDEVVVARGIYEDGDMPLFRSIRVDNIVGTFAVHGFIGDQPLAGGTNASRRPFSGVLVDFLVAPRDTR